MHHSFRLLKELLSHLSAKEIQSLKKNISATKDVIDGRISKSQQLVNLIIKEPNITAANAGKLLYSLPNRIAFSKLIDRTIDKIDDLLILFNRDNFHFSSERNYYYFSLKRKLIVIQMRILRGVESNIDWQFERLLTISKRYEFYDILIDALYFKQGLIFGSQMVKEVMAIQKKITFYEEIRKKIQLTRTTWNRVSTLIMQSSSERDFQQELEIAVSRTKIDYSETLSPTIQFYHLFLKVEALQIVENYKEAGDTLKEIFNLLNSSPSVNTKTRMGNVLINIANNNIYLNDFENAKLHIKRALAFVEDNTINFIEYKEVEFFVNFYNSELSKAEKLIEYIYELSFNRNIPLHLNKRAFLFASIKTIKGEFDRSNELLLQAKELDKNRGEWNIAKRVLSIINCIEIGETEKAELLVMNLEKFIKRNSKLQHIRKRHKLILRILINLVNEGFDFDIVYKNRKRYIDLLESEDPQYAWKYKSPELLVFTDWFRSKMYETPIALQKVSR